jgi:hypothetical protein
VGRGFPTVALPITKVPIVRDDQAIRVTRG